MATPVVVVPAGGLPVTEALSPYGWPMVESPTGHGLPVTFSTGGIPVAGISAGGASTTVIEVDGIVATFTGTLTTGYHVDGVSPWVVAPAGGVVLQSVALHITEASAGGYIGTGNYLGGVMIDPAGVKQGWDSRVNGSTGVGPGQPATYDAALALSLPATVDHYPDGSPKTIWLYRGTDDVQAGGQYNACYHMLQITVYASNPGSTAIKPTGLYVAGGKPTYTTASINYSLYTPITRPVGYVEPNWSLVGYHTRPMVKFGPITYFTEWSPVQSQLIYPAYQAAYSHRMILGALSDSPSRNQLINRIVRDGLMAHSMVALGYPCNIAIGGYGPGMKGLAYFAGRFLGVPAMCARPAQISPAPYTNQDYWHEDGCCFAGASEALYGTKVSSVYGTPPYHDNHDVRDIGGVTDPTDIPKLSGVAQSGTAYSIQLAAGSAAPSVQYNHVVHITGGTGSGQTKEPLHWDNTTKQLLVGPFVYVGSGSGTAQAGGASTITLQASLSPSIIAGHHIFITGGTGAGQGRTVSTWNAGTKLATMTAPWTTQPDATSVYVTKSGSLFSPAPASGSTYKEYNMGGYQIIGTQCITGLAIALVLAGETVGWGHDPFFEYTKRWIDEAGLVRFPYPGVADERQPADADDRKWSDSTNWTKLFYDEAEPLWPGAPSVPTTIYSQSLTTNDSGREDASARMAVNITGDPAGATQIRVTFAASAAAAFNCDNCSIGISTLADYWDTSATPTSLLFSAAANFSCSANSTVTSDWLTIAGSAVAGLTAADVLVVVMDISSTNGNPKHITGINNVNIEGGGMLWLSTGAGNTYNVAAPAGGTSFGARNHGVTSIEVQ